MAICPDVGCFLSLYGQLCRGEFWGQKSGFGVEGELLVGVVRIIVIYEMILRNKLGYQSIFQITLIYPN